MKSRGLGDVYKRQGLLTPDTDDITRLTIVNNKGRALEEWEINNLRLETQDDGRTLKIFYTKEQA